MIRVYLQETAGAAPHVFQVETYDAAEARQAVADTAPPVRRIFALVLGTP